MGLVVGPNCIRHQRCTAYLFLYHCCFKEEQNLDTAQRLLALIDQDNDHRLSVQEIHAFANINSKVISSFKQFFSK